MPLKKMRANYLRVSPGISLDSGLTEIYAMGLKRNVRHIWTELNYMIVDIKYTGESNGHTT